MFSYLLKTTLCWALFYLLYHLWLGKETFFKINRWYLLGTALLGIIIPAIDFQWLVPVHEEPAILHYMQPITIGMEQLETVIVTASAEEAVINWWGLLIKIYWLGAAIAFARFIYGVFKINKLYNEGEKSIFNNYQFVLTSALHVPFSFFKNLFWSKNFKVDEEDKQSILRHEEAHIFQWHSIDIILFEILGILFWCIPFIYFYKKAIKTTHEYLADDYVVAQASRKKYGQLLLRQSQSGMTVAISNSLFSSQLKNRIVMMTKNRSTKMASLKYLAGLPLLALLFLAFSFDQKTPDPQERVHPVLKAPTATDTLPDAEVYKVVEEKPFFPGCEELTDAEQKRLCSQKKMLEFIYTNIKYPKEAREKGTEGMSVVQFVVEKNGSIADAEIIRSIGGECDEEVLKVVYMMPNWIPGKQQGEAVRTQFILPVKFKLDASAPNTKKEGNTFEDVDEMPILASCADLEGNERMKCSKEGLVNAIYSKIKYPKGAKEEKVEGTVIVKFTIDENGDVVKPEITRSLGSGCDEEVLRVVGEMPKWVPGKKDGKPVAVELTLPVKFLLNGEDKIMSIDDSKINEASVVLKTFPNPATDNLSLEIKLAPGKYKLTMTDLNGKVIHSKNIQDSGGKTLNITDFPVKDVTRGTLYVTITDEKGKVVKSSTVVLQ